MRFVAILLVLALQGCNPWENEDEANLESFVELNGEYFGYYSQEMWDGTIQFLIKSKLKPENTIESPLGVPTVSKEFILTNDFKQPNNFSNASLEIEEGKVVFCSASGCRNITNTAIRRQTAARLL